jgi:Tfp pilus assembly protein PilX
MRKGYVLVLVLAIVIVLSLGILAVIKSTGSLATVKIRDLQELKAQYLAEAGMTYANWKCKKDGCHTLNATSPALPKAITGFDRDILITTSPTTPNTPPYKITVSVDYADI